jgi:hypothetical protein
MIQNLKNTLFEVLTIDGTEAARPIIGHEVLRNVARQAWSVDFDKLNEFGADHLVPRKMSNGSTCALANCRRGRDDISADHPVLYALHVECQQREGLAQATRAPSSGHPAAIVIGCVISRARASSHAGQRQDEVACPKTGAMAVGTPFATRSRPRIGSGPRLRFIKEIL